MPSIIAPYPQCHPAEEPGPHLEGKGGLVLAVRDPSPQQIRRRARAIREHNIVVEFQTCADGQGTD